MKAEIAIIGGCGHVGLPLGLAFARAGRTTVAVDVDPKKIQSVTVGHMPFSDRGADKALTQVLAAGTFWCTADLEVVREVSSVIVVIGTPLDEFLNPDFKVMMKLVDMYAPYLRSGQLFVLRSTVYPGTTAKVEDALRHLNLEIDVAFCPERVAEGIALEEIGLLPQIVGGCTSRAASRAEELFQSIVPEVIHLQPTAAELAKLFTNAWRYAQFALANQFLMIANDHGIDFYDIFHAMTEKYPRAQSFCGAGFSAGPCLFKDTAQLTAFHNNAFLIGHAAILINEGLPNYIVRRLVVRFPLRRMTVAILGMAFKGDSDDTRNSLSYKLRKILSVEAKRVICSDPHIEGTVPLAEAIQQADLVIIGAPHSEYRGKDFGNIPVVDLWNCVPGRLKTL